MTLKLLFTATLAILFTTSVPCSARKNVLFIISDDLRPQLGAYYGPNFPSPVHPPMHTPNLDALASRSLLLKRAYVQQALCSPSRTSFLTGRRPDTTRVWDLDHYFRNVSGNFTTLPEYFKLQGYKTFGMGKVYHGNMLDPPSWSEPYFHGVANFESRDHSWRAVPDAELKDTPLIDRQIADNAIQTLRSLASEAKAGVTNFFMAVGFQKPHLPFVFPESVMQNYYPETTIRLPDNPYAPVHMPNIAWYSNSELRSQYADIRKLNTSGSINTTFPDQVTLDLRRAYYSAVTWMDSLVGDVINELENLGLANNTIISFVGDHGWQLGEHGEWSKMTNFELSTHAPMLIRIPGLTDSGIMTERLTEFVDLYPTIVEAAGLGSIPSCPLESLNVPTCSEGTSLLPLISDPNTAIKRAAFSQYPRRENIMGYSIRTERFRYTEWVGFQYAPFYRPTWDKLIGVELYDHTLDPNENYNAAYTAKYQHVRGELRKLLHRGWRHRPDEVSEILG